MDECGISGVVYTEDTLHGVIESGGAIQGNLETEGVLIGEVGFPKCFYPEIYDGEYEVTPKTHEQHLATNQKFMEDDVTIKKIPYYETSNDYGTTCYIAGDINYG